MLPIAGMAELDLPPATGADAWATRPVTESELRRALDSAFDPERTTQTLPSGLPAEVKLSAKILLVEDNVVNAEIAAEMLGAMGCSVVLAGDGKEAVSKVSGETFDLILMDCQMPVMDGFEATALIRDMEDAAEKDAEKAAESAPDATRDAASAGRPRPRRVPIVALTANALRGDRERCILAGMDDHLAKPFKKADLYQVLVRWISGANKASEANEAKDLTAPPAGEALAELLDKARSGLPPDGAPIRERRRAPPAPAEDAVDRDVLLSSVRLNGRVRRSMLEKLTALFLIEAPRLIGNMNAGLKASDMPSLQVAAHQLKSSSAWMGAMPMSGLAHQIEALATGGKMAEVAPLVSALQAQFDQVALVLPALRDEICAQADREDAS